MPCFSAVCFFICLSFTAVINAFWAFLSSRYSSALYCFNCIVSVLVINFLFIHTLPCKISVFKKSQFLGSKWSKLLCKWSKFTTESLSEKKFENWLIYSEVMDKSLVSCFLTHSVAINETEASFTLHEPNWTELNCNMTSCHSTDYERPHHCCHLPNKVENIVCSQHMSIHIGYFYTVYWAGRCLPEKNKCCFFLGRDPGSHLFSTRFLGPIWANILNGTSISWAVFVGLMIVNNKDTHTQTTEHT